MRAFYEQETAIVVVQTPDGDIFTFGPYGKAEAEKLAEMAVREGSDFEGCEAVAESLCTFADAQVAFGPKIRVGNIVKFDPSRKGLVWREIHGKVVVVNDKMWGSIIVITGQGEQIAVTDWELVEGFDLLMDLHAQGEDTLIGRILDLADWGCSLSEAKIRALGERSGIVAEYDYSSVPGTSSYIVRLPGEYTGGQGGVFFRGTFNECQNFIYLWNKQEGGIA